MLLGQEGPLIIGLLAVIWLSQPHPSTSLLKSVHTLAASAPILTQADTITYKFRPNAWMLVLLYQCLVMLLSALKLLHVSSVADWSWGWVTLPIWAPGALLALVLGGEQLMRLAKGNAKDSMRSLIIMETTANC
jgi:cation transport ATPase